MPFAPMPTPAPPHKTQLGIDELRSRTHGLNQRHRTMLVLVDGQRPLSEVLALGLQAGARTTHFADLVHLGLVEVALDPAQPVVALPVADAENSGGNTLSGALAVDLAPPASRRAPAAASEREELHQEVRELLIDTLRIDAPLYAAVTLVRVRRAKTTRELINLVWDIERHLVASAKSQSEMRTLYRARELLGMGNTQISTDSPTGLGDSE